MSYVDGFLAAVPTGNREKFRKHAEEAAVLFKEHGALRVIECWGDDVPEGELTSFSMAVKREDEQAFALANGGNLMFCEDAARRIQKVLDEIPAIADFHVRLEHQESLHAHDAVAFTSKRCPVSP